MGFNYELSAIYSELLVITCISSNTGSSNCIYNKIQQQGKQNEYSRQNDCLYLV